MASPEVAAKIEEFRTLLRQATARFPSWQPAPDCAVIVQDLATMANLGSSAGLRERGAGIKLTLSALIHGNETGGTDALVSVLKDILANRIKLRAPIGIALGNPAAAMAGRRFIDRDLNRSFGLTSLGSGIEPARARELQTLLAQSQHLVDFHQTREPSQTAFFIFPFARKSFDFARAISPELPVVTHWGGSFSNDGMCSDEYVNARGGTGITIELGQCGIDPDQAALGRAVALRALHVSGAADVDDLPAIAVPDVFRKTVYTWQATIPYPAGAVVDLRAGLVNFAQVQAGEAIGDQDGSPVRVPAGGRILFPKYIRPGSPEASAPRPAELVRIMRPLTEEDLPR